jgi:hypothetical protein
MVNNYHFYYSYPASTDFRTDYDANGNLTSFRVLNDDGSVWLTYTVSYNAGNKPVAVEGIYASDNSFFLKHIMSTMIMDMQLCSTVIFGIWEKGRG